MKSYQLKQPAKKPLSERVPFYIFVGIISAFLLWIILIRPMAMPADQMPFIFEYNPETREVYPEAQKRTYFLLTGSAILGALVFTGLTIRAQMKWEKAMAYLWENREYVEHEEYMRLMDKLNSKMFSTNADQIMTELQRTVDKHKGKHIVGRKYLKKEHWKDLDERVA